MQRIRSNGRRRIIFEIVALSLIVLFVALDQITKYHFAAVLQYGQTQPVIEGFFYFTYVLNKGAAWSFLNDVAWAQTVFKILTLIAIAVFGYFSYISSKKGYKWLKIALSFAISGALGNFIDRVILGSVIDFIGFTFGTYNFPIFNLADSFLVVGVAMIMIHLFFLDKNAIFKRKDGQKED